MTYRVSFTKPVRAEEYIKSGEIHLMFWKFAFAQAFADCNGFDWAQILQQNSPKD